MIQTFLFNVVKTKVADPEFTGTVESLSRENKHIVLETEDDALIECIIKWLSMYNKTVQQKIMEKVVKQETEEEEVEVEVEVEVEEEQKEPQEPTVPPPTTVSMERQTDDSFLSETEAGSSSQKQEPVPPEGSGQTEVSGEQQTDIQKDDTAPKPETAKRLYYGADITGNEGDSVFRKLSKCFSDGYPGEWAGFYNQGYPASSQHQHMFWHAKYRKTMTPHQDHWYTNTDDQLMEEYIARHKDELPLKEPEDIKNSCEYSCSDPRLHRQQEHSEKAATEAEGRIEDDFKTLTTVLECCVENHKALPYCIVLQCLASRYLGRGMFDPTYYDEPHPYRSPPRFSLMFWNLENWCRTRFSQCPLPERLQKFAPHIDYELNSEHEKFGDKPQFNNYFINVIKNLGAHLLMNCEAGSLYPHKALLEEERFTTCFMAARLGKGGYVRQIAGYNTSDDDTRVRYVSWAIFEVYWGKTKHRNTEIEEPLTRGRMNMCRVCVCLPRRTEACLRFSRHHRRVHCAHGL